MLHSEDVAEDTEQQRASLVLPPLSIDDPYNARVMIACGLPRVPDRRTFDRRLKNISSDGSDEDLRPRIDVMGQLFIAERLVDPYIVSVDSSLLRARGGIWHKKFMEKRIVPHRSIDTDARWGKSRSRGGGSSATSSTCRAAPASI